MTKMINKSGLKPKGHAVLVEAYEPELKSSIIEIPENYRQHLQTLENRVVVIEAGPEAWCEEREPRAKPGDKVLVTKYAGFGAVGTADGKPYRLVNDRDIFCQIGVES
jgi:co-chaperonin GroES (HSP10)